MAFNRKSLNPCRLGCIVLLGPCFFLIYNTYLHSRTTGLDSLSVLPHRTSTSQIYDQKMFKRMPAELIFHNGGDKKSAMNTTEILNTLQNAFISFSKEHTTTLKHYNIDIENSVIIGIDRPVPDTVPSVCSYDQKNATTRLPKVSIIIPFYFEHWSVLLRALYNIYKKTDLKLIQDIVLVDDSNESDLLPESFRKHIKHLPRLTLLRTHRRQGLIRARLLGAQAAWGQILVIMDAHMELQEHWLEPLIQEIMLNKTTIAVPSLDYVDPISFTYTKWPYSEYGSFDWELDYLWVQMPKDVEEVYKSGKSVATATFLGSAMAVDRNYFFAMGGYDDDLSFWGGESLEISFRTWMCGGKVMIVPCSRIGHLFRSHLPYTFGTDIVYKNLQRVAEVWMDDYKKWFFITTGKPLVFSHKEQETLRERKRFRDASNCKSFSWYLKNIAKTLVPPLKPSTFSGYMKNLGTQKCMEVDSSSQGITLSRCHSNPMKKVFHFRDTRLLEYTTGQCLTFTNNGKGLHALLKKCNASDATQKWSFSPVVPDEIKKVLQGTEVRKPVGQFRWDTGNLKRCLAAVNEQDKNMYTVKLLDCDFLAISQYWVLAHKLNTKINIPDNIKVDV